MNQEYNLPTEEAIQKIREEYKNLTSMFIHELRNPLSLIKGTLQYIELKYPEAKDYKYWGQLFELIGEMEKMMSDASLLNSCAALNMKHTNLLNLIQGVVNNYKPQAENQNKQLSVKTSQDCKEILSSYYCDPDKIKQVISNLIKNALEATSPGNFIEVVISTDSYQSRPMLSIQVNNNGPKIPEDQIENILKPFVTYKKGGSGIGLALAKRIIENHMGSISVSSSEALTSFNILLPIYNL
ncbi:MAG TPA: HAMP domain-containing sensor histidine kinase [Mobilitalea sp.]|nr:HAMP domain-containing sensor histidine kinase [Mobilitalea sp.]